MMKNKIILLAILYLVCCGSTEEPSGNAGRYDYSGSKIFLDVVENNGNLSLTVSVGDFEDIDNMSIDLLFDYNAMEIIGFQNGDFTNLDDANSFKLGLPDSQTSFVFTNVSSSGTLFELDFNSSNVKETAILINSSTLDMIKNGKSIYYYCTDSKYENNVACLNSGNFWRQNYDALEIESTCYVDAHPDNGDQYGEYAWRIGEYCKVFYSW